MVSINLYLVSLLFCLSVYKHIINALPLQLVTAATTFSTSTTATTTTVTAGCLIEEDTDYYGNDIAGPKIMEDTDKCTLWCSSVSECTHWVYQAENRPVGERHCWLKNSNSGKRKIEGSISGNRKCSGKKAVTYLLLTYHRNDDNPNNHFHHGNH